MESIRQLNGEKYVIKDTEDEPRPEFEVSIDEQEVEVSFDETKVEDWCALLDNPTRNVAERATMITSLQNFAEFLAEDDGSDVVSRVEMCGGLARIKQLQSHTNEPIRHRCQDILAILSNKARSRGG